MVWKLLDGVGSGRSACAVLKYKGPDEGRGKGHAGLEWESGLGRRGSKLELELGRWLQPRGMSLDWALLRRTGTFFRRGAADVMPSSGSGLGCGVNGPTISATYVQRVIGAGAGDDLEYPVYRRLPQRLLLRNKTGRLGGYLPLAG